LFPTGGSSIKSLFFLSLSLCFPFLSRQRAAATGLGGTQQREIVEEEAANEVKRHYELLVENGGGLARTAAEGVILMQAGLGPRGGRGVVMA
jgi:hypothetical protein